MELITVGTGTVAPSAQRTAACHWVSRGNVRALLDCGPGTLHRLALFGLPWQDVTHVVVSHFHPDHYAELPMMVYALKYASVQARAASERARRRPNRCVPRASPGARESRCPGP